MADVKNLTDAQLEHLERAPRFGATPEDLEDMVRQFQEINSLANFAPGPPKPPLPATLDPRDKTILSDKERNSVPLWRKIILGEGVDKGSWPVRFQKDPFVQSPFSTDNIAGRTAARMANDSGIPYSVRRDPKQLGDKATREVQDISRLTAAAMPLAGGISAIPLTLSALGYATTKTPGDLGTSAALLGTGGALRGAQSASRVPNILSRMLQGAGMYEGGSRLNALLNGRPQPAADPRNRPVMDNIFGLLSAGLGASQGASEVPRKLSEKQSQFQSAMAKFLTNQEQLKEYQGKVGEIKSAISSIRTAEQEAKNAILSATNAHIDASKRLRAFERQMKAKMQTATSTEQADFRTQQAALREEEKALRFQLEDTKKSWTAAKQALDDHLKATTEATKLASGDSAEVLADKILKLDERLDGLRNPERRELFLQSSPEIEDVQKRIADLTARLDSGKGNAGIVSQIEDALETNRNKLEDLLEGNVRSAIDDAKAQKRELLVAQRRLNQGRGEPSTNVSSADDKITLGIRGAHDESAKALEELNRKYQAKVLERLRHAKNTPGASVADVDEVFTHRQLLDAAEKALEAQRKASVTPGQMQLRIKQFEEKLADLEKNKPFKIPEPKPEAENPLLSLAKVAGKTLPAVGGASAGSLLFASPVLGTLSGLALQKLSSTDAGKKLLEFFNKRVGPSALQMVPGLVNENANNK